MELLSFSVSGFRSLRDVRDIPMRRPTIVTGANDGGKSSTIGALEFLLDGPIPRPEDFSLLGPPSEEGGAPLRVPRCEVVGVFRLSKREVDELELDPELLLRRVAVLDGSPRYEIMRRVPEEPRLRDLEALGLAALQERAEQFGLVPEGRANAKVSWLKPLLEFASKQPHCDDWSPAPRSVIDRLPRLMRFSSTEEPDPAAQVHAALRTAFDAILDDDELVGPVRKAEAKAQKRLREEAEALCRHIRERCPELREIAIEPDVTFREGFRRVTVLTARGHSGGVTLDRSGAGRRRRVNLAIWEWAGRLLEDDPNDGRHVIVAYDEPDTHLDYANQRELVDLIRDQCRKPRVAMLVATHSLNLIDRVDIADVIHLRLRDEMTTVERLLGEEHEDVQQYLADVSAAMGLRNSVLLHERCFVGIEGITESQAFPVLFRTATSLTLQAAGISLIVGDGNEGALRLAKFLNDHGRRMAFVVDRDSTTKEGSRRLFQPARLRAAGIGDDQVHYVGKAELEDLFTDNQWAAVANREWDRVDGRQWVEDDFRSLRATGKFSPDPPIDLRERV